MKYIWIISILILIVYILHKPTSESFQSNTIQVQLVRDVPYATISVEIARTSKELQNGLMYRTHLPENNGMLFVFPTESHQSFWMRNTLIPLDMLFLKEDGRIVTIHKTTKTQSDQQYPSSEPAKYGIELPAGTVGHLGIRLGDRAVGPAFGI